MLAIIALVVGMTISTGTMQLDIARFQGAKQNLEVVRAALNLFQKKHDRYPCPADPVLATSHANYGVEYNSGSCTAACPMGGLSCGTNAVIGAVPFRTLGISEGLSYDPWDRRITYAVDKNHTAISASTRYKKNGKLSVQDGAGNEITASPVLGKALFVLASHGEDGNGGYTKAAALAKACGATAKDIENCDYNDDIFAAAPFNNGSVAASFFDDFVAWQTQESVQVCSGTTSGLVGHWKFDETSGTTAKDSSDNGNTGTLMSGPVWQPTGGQVGGALSFDGVDDYVDAGTSLSPTSGISICTWIYMRSWGASGTTDQDIIVRKSTSDWNSNFTLEFNSATYDGGAHRALTFWSNDTVPGLDADEDQLGLNVWNHVCATYDNTTGTIYINGQQVVTDTPTNDLGTASQTLFIGGKSGAGDVMDGLLDDLRIYDRALSAQEVQDWYDCQKP